MDLIEQPSKANILAAARIHQDLEEILDAIKQTGGYSSKFVEDYEEAVKLAVMCNLNNLPRVDFGDYDPLVEQIIDLLKIISQKYSERCPENVIEQILGLKKDLSAIMNALSAEGVHWLPESAGLTAAYAAGALTPLGLLSYSARGVTMGAWNTYDLPSDTTLIVASYALYLTSLLLTHRQEVATLNEGSNVVFSPYVSALSLVTTPEAASRFVRFIEFLVTSSVVLPSMIESIFSNSRGEIFQQSTAAYIFIATIFLLVDILGNKTLSMRYSHKEG